MRHFSIFLLSMLRSSDRLLNVIRVNRSSKIRPIGRAALIDRRVWRGYGLE